MEYSAELFARVATQACVRFNIDTRFRHLDSSSFHLHGAYDATEPEREAVHITHGYSKEERPDLKQYVGQKLTVMLCTVHLGRDHVTQRQQAQANNRHQRN